MEDKKKEKLYLKYNKYFPTKYVEHISNITAEDLKHNHIEGVILDLDNTIITNNFLKKRIEKVTNKYNLEYILFARKPNIKGLLAAKKIMGIENNENIAVIRRPSIYRCTSEGTMQEWKQYL